MGCEILDPVAGWEVLWCPECGYALEKCRLTRNFVLCPICARKGKRVKLEERYVVHYPENKVLKPKGR